MQAQDRRSAPHSLLLPFAGAAALVLALLIARGVPQGTPTAPVATVAPIAPPTGAAREPAPKGADPVATALPAVSGWKGTEVEGGIHLDAAGNLIPDQELHELFDYLLSASNVLNPEQIRQQLLAIGRRHALPGSAMNQLDGSFARYNDYRAAAARLPGDNADLEAMTHSFEDRHQLRQDRLGPKMADGFFGESEAQDRYQLAVLAVMNNKSLGDDERQRQLAALKEQAPAAVIAARQPSEALQALETRTELLRQTGADESQIQALRIQSVGPEAAARMRTLDEANTAWNQRMAALRQARSQILADAGIAQADKPYSIDDYIDKNFSGPEAIRARALLSLDQAASN